MTQANAAAGTRTTFVPDIQGSIIATLDSSTGALAKTGYLPYGGSSATPITFGYTAQRIDPETNGLYYYRARHYSAAWGRLMQPDPIGYRAGVNLYTYVNNDPLNLVDPSGLAGDSPSAADGPPPTDSPSTTQASTIALPGVAVAGEAAGATVAITGALALGILATTTTSTAGRTQDEVQYVVRAGAGAASTFEQGTQLTTNGYGFSVQTAPNVEIDQLARGGYFPNRQISVSTVQTLQAIPGVTVTFPTPGSGDYHGTVNVPNPPPPGLFDVISAAFVPRTNPFPVAR